MNNGAETRPRTPVSLFGPLILVLLGSAPAASQTLRPFAEAALSELERTFGEPARLTISPTKGVVTFLSFDPSRQPLVSLSGSQPAEARALDFLVQYGASFGILDRDSVSLKRASGRDEVGMEHVRFQQMHQGIPVTGGELTLHLRGSAVVAVNAKTLADLERIDTSPAITAAEATDLAVDALEKSLGVTDATLSAPRLELLNKGLLGGGGLATALTWFIEATKIDLREYLWIDADAGKVVLQFSQLTDAKNRLIYDADDPYDGVYGDLPGGLVRSEGDSATSDTDVDDAYDYSGDTYDYFFNEHGRDSYDDAGATLISSVHYCPDSASCPFLNAFWNGAQMVYGDGFSAADDVVAHELTHAVTERTAGLFYYMQSGALNESYSDIFGETVDLTNSGGTDTSGVRWRMGEDVPVFGALRDMMDPTAFADPGKMTDAEFYCGDDYTLDGGGVHTNSGVPNHAYALMVDGGAYNSKTMTGIGLTKAGKIQYRALSRYLLSASDFLDNYNALEQSCQDLMGTAGITASDCIEVGDALDAVEMSDVWPCPPTQATVPAFCPPGQAPNVWAFSDMESLGITPCPSNAVLSVWCLNGPSSLLGSFATSGVNSVWGYNQPSFGTMSLTFSASTLPANARMQFNHSFGFENNGSNYYDGAVIEFSTNGGSTWTDIGGLITAGQAYGGTIDNCCLNPLADRNAFVGDSWGYTASQLDLSTYSGNTFLVRFLIGTDLVIDEYGWFIDDLRVYTCAECLADRVLDNASSGTASLYKASNSISAGSGFSVGPGEDVTFEAGNVIALESGFAVTSGGELTAKITPGVCP
jgi:bacillolysin